MRALTVFLLLAVAVPAAFAHSLTISQTLTAPPKAEFTTFPIPAGGTYTIGKIGNFWELSGTTSAANLVFSFDVDHTKIFGDFFGGSVFLSTNGITYGGMVIEAHLNGSLLSGGWTSASQHGRFDITLNANGQLGAGTFFLANAPEPGTLSLMGTGLIAILAGLRRKLRTMR
jgi:hypothetical protein